MSKPESIMKWNRHTMKIQSMLELQAATNNCVVRLDHVVDNHFK